jgi:hypothetical protein
MSVRQTRPPRCDDIRVDKARPSSTRVVGAVALALLTACGVTLWLIAPRPNEAHASSASLLSRSDWVLATALPTSGDFPADWGYSLAGRLRRAAPTGTAPSSTRPRPGPAAAAYEPATCGDLPKILSQSGDALAAYVQVDRFTQIFVQDAVPGDAAATGERREHGPNARFSIWAVPDSQARIAGYLDWLGRCGSYRVTNYDRGSEVKSDRAVTTQVEARSADGADAAVVVTRTFTPSGSIDPPSTYHVAYYAVRGVLLECAIYMEGADADVVRQVATRTLQKLRDL